MDRDEDPVAEQRKPAVARGTATNTAGDAAGDEGDYADRDWLDGR
ncbi:MAG: hypothetical protein ACRDQ5_02000 [Sciscionella sp.]